MRLLLAWSSVALVAAASAGCNPSPSSSQDMSGGIEAPRAAPDRHTKPRRQARNDDRRAKARRHTESRNGSDTLSEFLAEYDDSGPEPGAQGAWTCSYDPTMNYDWHDDALCSNGVERVRPYLLADDSFVEYDELMQAAADYAAAMNGS